MTAHLGEQLALDALPLRRKAAPQLVSREEIGLELEEAVRRLGRVGHCHLPLCVSCRLDTEVAKADQLLVGRDAQLVAKLGRALQKAEKV